MLLLSAVSVARDKTEAETAAAEACSAVAEAEIADEADAVDVVADCDAAVAEYDSSAVAVVDDDEKLLLLNNNAALPLTLTRSRCR